MAATGIWRNIREAFFPNLGATQRLALTFRAQADEMDKFLPYLPARYRDLTLDPTKFTVEEVTVNPLVELIESQELRHRAQAFDRVKLELFLAMKNLDGHVNKRREQWVRVSLVRDAFQAAVPRTIIPRLPEVIRKTAENLEEITGKVR